MKYVHPMQYIPPGAPYDTYPAILVHKCAFRDLNVELPSSSIHTPHLSQRTIQLYQPPPQICAMSPENESMVAVVCAMECI